jgi:hypothetical protein
MDLYRRRPRPRVTEAPPERDSGALEDRGFVHGKCFLAEQSHLVFGGNRRIPVAWRPVVSWAVSGPRIYVLPSTTQVTKGFFHLPPDACFLKRPPPRPMRDGYLRPLIEVLDQHHLIEIGVLPHRLRIAIADWKKWTRGHQ